jgi:hypothetical protein
MFLLILFFSVISHGSTLNWDLLLPPKSSVLTDAHLFLNTSSYWNPDSIPNFSWVLVADYGNSLILYDIQNKSIANEQARTGVSYLKFSSSENTAWITFANGSLWTANSQLQNWQLVVTPDLSVTTSILSIGSTLYRGTSNGRLYVSQTLVTLPYSKSAIVQILSATYNNALITILGFADGTVLISGQGTLKYTQMKSKVNNENLRGLILHKVQNSSVLIIATSSNYGRVYVYSLYSTTELMHWNLETRNISKILLTTDKDFKDTLIIGCEDGNVLSILLDGLPTTWLNIPVVQLTDVGIAFSKVTALAYNWMEDSDSQNINPVLLVGHANGLITALFPNSTNWITIATPQTWKLVQAITEITFVNYKFDKGTPEIFSNYILVALSQGEVRMLRSSDESTWNFLYAAPSLHYDRFQAEVYSDWSDAMVEFHESEPDDLWTLAYEFGIESLYAPFVRNIPSKRIKASYLNTFLSFNQLQTRVLANRRFLAILTTTSNPSMRLVLSILGFGCKSDPARLDVQEVVAWNYDSNSQYFGKQTFSYSLLFAFPYNSTVILYWTSTIILN